MKTRGKINVALANSHVMNMAGGGRYYTPMDVQRESLQESRVEWNSSAPIIKKLLNTFKGWRGNYEYTAYIQVCE